MAETSLRILIVDDDHLQLSMVGRALRSEGFTTEVADSAIGVTNTIRSFAPDLVLLDVRIPELPGDRLLPLLRRSAPKGTLLILYSASDRDQLRSLAAQVGADGWISKSDDIFGLGKKLRGLIEKERAKQAAPVRK